MAKRTMKTTTKCTLWHMPKWSLESHFAEGRCNWCGHEVAEYEQLNLGNYCSADCRDEEDSYQAAQDADELLDIDAPHQTCRTNHA